MSWLKKEAEAALSVLRDCKCKFDPEVRCFSCDVAIVEQVARAFAERAALEAYRKGIEEGESSASAYEHGCKYTPTEVKEVIADSLEAADKDEP
jgi:hypothetical protein